MSDKELEALGPLMTLRLKLTAAENRIEQLSAVADAARRVDRGHWFAEGGYIPESDWIALMNTLAALDDDNE